MEFEVSEVVEAPRVRSLDEVFERPAGFELTAFWEEWSHAFEQSRPTVEVTVRVSEDVRRFLPGEPRIEADGGVVVAFDSLAEAHRELLRFGADLEVLEPPSCATGSAGRAARWPRCTLSSPVGA